MLKYMLYILCFVYLRCKTKN